MVNSLPEMAVIVPWTAEPMPRKPPPRGGLCWSDCWAKQGASASRFKIRSKVNRDRIAFIDHLKRCVFIAALLAEGNFRTIALIGCQIDAKSLSRVSGRIS